MENLKGLIKDPTIEQFLKQYPTEEWCEVLKKTLKCGIYSMNTLEKICHGSKIEKKTIKKNCDNDEKANNKHTEEDIQHINNPIHPTKDKKSEQKPFKRKRKSQILLVKPQIQRSTPRAKHLELEICLDKKDKLRLNSAKTIKTRTNSTKNSKHGSFFKNESTVKHQPDKIETNYIDGTLAKSFHNLTSKILENYINPKSRDR
ncbi:hypothetical protein SteCoe_29194 [Stentor coeruleus]|uniref:Uncharacterized protein n=1 Tax=Stentor coeruleus TaxID=5963 RepID=A0A1R2B6I8_9CILI|nr:hypothetical protein SteCoe_29194 [Stentor coeruleus]